MKDKKILFCLFVFIVFLSSCDKNQAGRNFSYSPINKILKMNPVKISVASWIEYEKHILRLPTEEDAIRAIEEPNNWTVYLETTDVTQINTIMAALRIPMVESSRCGLGNPNIGEKICFEDKNGKARWTVMYLSVDEKKIYSPDGVYGEETYCTLEGIFKPAYMKFESERAEIQESNQPVQKPSVR
jgi:hypothetical protein